MNDLEKAEAIHTRMLNQFGISELIKLNVYKDLALALNEKDYAELEENNIYINPLFSPASQSNLDIDLPKGAKIITLDINSLKYLSSGESVAIILHEIGHAINHFEKGENGEFIADDYAVARSYKEALLKSLFSCKKLWPEEFEKKITEKRINRLK
jgi:hypothetical protein